MKIAIDTSCLAINRISGLGEFVHHLLLHLPCAASDNHFTLFFNFFRGHALNGKILYSGTTNRFLKIPRRLIDLWWVFDWPQIDFYLKGVDIFHSVHINVPPAKKIKTILTVHDCRYIALPELYSSRVVKEYCRKMKKALSRVDHVVTVSEFTRNELIKYFSFPEDRIRTIKNGFVFNFSEEKLEQKKFENVLAQKQLPEEYILYTGVLDPRKNLSKLIEAFHVCRKKSENFPNLVLAGITFNQWIKCDQAKKAKKLDVFNNIHIAGIINKCILYGLIRRAIALCYPSLYEGFGFPPLEAMSLGVPVLAGKSSSIPEVTGNAACLVDPLDVEDMAKGLYSIIFDSEYRKELVQLGFNQTKKFSWSQTAAEYIRLYKEVLKY